MLTSVTHQERTRIRFIDVRYHSYSVFCRGYFCSIKERWDEDTFKFFFIIYRCQYFKLLCLFFLIIHPDLSWTNGKFLCKGGQGTIVEMVGLETIFSEMFTFVQSTCDKYTFRYISPALTSTAHIYLFWVRPMICVCWLLLHLTDGTIHLTKASTKR